MIRTCNNCAGRLVYDIKRKGLYCSACDSVFSVKDISVNYNDIAGGEEETLDMNVYTCSSCGSEISISDTESSTFCVYCGNPNVIFSRVSKARKPKIIVPFEITRERAEEIIRQEVNKGKFIPKEVKNFKIDLLHGIYIPYYISKVEYDACMILYTQVKSEVKKNDYNVYPIKSSFYATLPWITIDASEKLNNDISECLEPYNMQDAKIFHEDYLLGFYSDASDSNIYDAIDYSAYRAEKLVEEEIIARHPSQKTTIKKKRADLMVYDKPVKALLPAWFLTYRYKDKPYTVIVNGQTGKLAGNFPWDRTAITVLSVLLGLLFTAVAFASYYILATFTLKFLYIPVYETINLVLGIASSLGMLAAGLIKFKKTNKSIADYKDSDLTKYISKRQKV
ncbi:MAG: hypothetical protein MJ103_09190 [Saccharofermentans sp.]|nr:hypothetical protein [Saccharofermentans sp.]